ncbi:hypothetical protein CFBP6600_40830 [Xanthomonas arboricola pv. corylina]|uniref:Uncharacterized protein n=1 Tax=Xanthomonas arboricola pv. corylina TaxID=487821 RepID=A0ABM8T1W6_9XANT|nr:hypothetical protein XAC301_41110 [Xanthomonas arboricola pv. corylina]CAE6850747.1 hypothetical protein XAC301_41110 [Xanthomonas arboricola pv. corylina]CAE6851123.1 hypothetical protein CFBP6600_40830 [Xanthomonas arboricola pv. corylina]CAE6851143.1 hypothetical protein CFBP6600_40830 [Xanthomonas arboricola pv. corylina]
MLESDLQTCDEVVARPAAVGALKLNSETFANEGRQAEAQLKLLDLNTDW